VGLRKEDAELLVYLVDEEKGHLYRRAHACLPPCQPGTAQLSPSATSVSLNLYELANDGHTVVYIERKERKEGLRHFAVHQDVNDTEFAQDPTYVGDDACESSEGLIHRLRRST
jgi:hypothetical protein